MHDGCTGRSRKIYRKQGWGSGSFEWRGMASMAPIMTMLSTTSQVRVLGASIACGSVERAAACRCFVENSNKAYTYGSHEAIGQTVWFREALASSFDIRN